MTMGITDRRVTHLNESECSLFLQESGSTAGRRHRHRHYSGEAQSDSPAVDRKCDKQSPPRRWNGSDSAPVAPAPSFGTSTASHLVTEGRKCSGCARCPYPSRRVSPSPRACCAFRSDATLTHQQGRTLRDCCGRFVRDEMTTVVLGSRSVKVQMRAHVPETDLDSSSTVDSAGWTYMSQFRSRLIACLSIIAVGLAASAWAQALLGSPPRNQRITTSDGASVDGRDPSLSNDGRYVAFVSGVTTLVAGDDNQRDDVFVYDRSKGMLERISVESQRDDFTPISAMPAISGNGRVVAFTLHERENGGSVSSTVYVHDRGSRRTVRVAEGRAASINIDGSYVAFQSANDTLVSDDTNEASDIYVLDRVAGLVTRASVVRGGVEANGPSSGPSLSANGRKLLFISDADNLVPGDTNALADLFVKDLRTGAVSRVNVGRSGQASGHTDSGALSADGKVVVFSSWASNLVPGDTNGLPDIFVRDLGARTTTRVSVDSFGGQANGENLSPTTNATGRYVVFWSARDEPRARGPAPGCGPHARPENRDHPAARFRCSR